MSTLINEKHQDNLKRYVNDMIGLERDIINAVESQLEDERVTAYSDLTAILQKIVAGAKSRQDALKVISEEEGGSVGAVIKEAAMSVTGALAGIYGKLREHPLSRIVRDDRMAMNMTETSYGMLYTLALSIGHGPCAQLALSGLNSAAPLVLELTDVLPQIILDELSEDAPLQNPDVADDVVDAIRHAWKN